MAYIFLNFVNIVTFLSCLIVAVLIMVMSKRFLGRISWGWLGLSFGIILIGLDNLFTLFSSIGYVSREFVSAFGATSNLIASILLLTGFTFALFELTSIYELRSLEERKKDIEFLLATTKERANDGLSREVINNLEKELIDIERRIEELR